MRSRKVLTDVLFGLVTKVAIRFRGVLLIPLITVNLGVSAFGAYAQILAIATLANTVIDFGLHQGLIRYGRRTDDTADLYFSSLLVVLATSGAAAVAMFAAAAPLSAFTLSSGQYADAYRVGALLLVVMAAFRLSKSYFRIDSRIKLFSIIEAADGYGTIGAAAIGVLLFDATLSQILLSIAAVRLATVLLLHGQIVREVGLRVPTFDGMRTYLDYSLPVALSLFVNNVSSRADRVMIGFFLGASAVGVYSIAYEIAVGIIMYVSAIRQTLFPELSKLVYV